MVQLTTKNIGGSLYKILVFCKYGAVLGFPRGSCLLSCHPFSEQQGELQPLYIIWEDDDYDSAADYDDGDDGEVDVELDLSPSNRGK